MSCEQLLQLLSKQQERLETEGNDWLQRYAGASTASPEFLEFTFFLICRHLSIQTDEFSRSTDIQASFEPFLNMYGLKRRAGRWNPISQFNRAWQQFEEWQTQPEQTRKSTHPYGFVTDHAVFLKHPPIPDNTEWQIGFQNDQYKACARDFFGSHRDGNLRQVDAGRTMPLTDMQKLAHRLFWDPPERMDHAAKLLDDKPQLIFYGPPGTGKTYVARALARHLADGEEPVFVQFHASYAYEDFVQGWRPCPADKGNTGFDLVPGHLLKAQEQAEKCPERKVVLLIDEINRANLPRVFGELFFSLEYRENAVQLQYEQNGEPFRLAKNLILLGTMNTADRGIAQIDAALRRRFHFFPLYPDKAPIKGLLSRYLHEHGRSDMAEWLPHVLDAANSKLAEHGFRDALIGPSHFMSPDVDEEQVRLTWNYSIVPMLEERYPGDERRVAEFGLDRLKGLAATTG